jgi:hypothetical protein
MQVFFLCLSDKVLKMIIFGVIEISCLLVTTEELGRLEAAFDKSRRDSMNLQSFCNEVLSSDAPNSATKAIFHKFANAGPKLTFEDMVIGLVTLTKAGPEDRKSEVDYTRAENSI